MDLVFELSLIALLVQLWRTRMFRVLPCFAARVAYFYLFDLAYQPLSADWAIEWYPWLAVPWALALLVSVAEGYVEHSADYRWRRLLAASALCFALVFASMVAGRYAGGGVLVSIIHARAVIVTGCAGFLAVYCLLFWSVGQWCRGVLGRHVAMLFWSSLAYAVAAVLRIVHPSADWGFWNGVFYLLQSAINLLWAFAIGFRRYSSTPSARPPYFQVA